MRPNLFGGTGVPVHPMMPEGVFADPLGWLLLAFGAFALIALVAVVLHSLHERLTQEDVRCPRTEEAAKVFVRRTAEGRVTGIASCSLMSPPTEVTCKRGCLAQVRC